MELKKSFYPKTAAPLPGKGPEIIIKLACYKVKHEMTQSETRDTK